jgi:hypothetical protein
MNADSRLCVFRFLDMKTLLVCASVDWLFNQETSSDEVWRFILKSMNFNAKYRIQNLIPEVIVVGYKLECKKRIMINKILYAESKEIKNMSLCGTKS